MIKNYCKQYIAIIKFLLLHSPFRSRGPLKAKKAFLQNGRTPAGKRKQTSMSFAKHELSGLKLVFACNFFIGD